MKINATQTTTQTYNIHKAQSTQKTKNSVWEDYNTSGEINGVIEPTEQGIDANDCWLLSTINGLSTTGWGQKAIKEAIMPDGEGGAVIYLYSPDGKKIEYKISAKEIEDGWNSPKYSSGDRDMVAFEIAFEKYFKKYYAKENLEGGDKYEENIAMHAITGKDNPMSIITSEENVNMALQEIIREPGRYSCTVSLKGTFWDGILPGHVYMIKSIERVSNDISITIVDPYDSSKEKTMDLETFKNYIVKMSVAEQDSAHKNPHIQSDEKGNDMYENIWKPNSDIRRYALTRNIPKLKKEIAKIDKNNVTYIVFRRNPCGDENCNLVRMLDNITFGWGNGKLKKELISPIIDAACEVAKENNLAPELIEEAKNACYAELNAIIYTNINVIERYLVTLLKDDYFKKYL